MQTCSLPMGVVSKKDVGERSTDFRAALNIVRLAARLNMLRKGVNEQKTT